MTRMNRDSI